MADEPVGVSSVGLSRDTQCLVPARRTRGGANLLGVGALGRPDGTQNHFIASASGTGQLNVIMPAGTLSFIPYNIGPCLLNDARIGEVQVHLAYHIDGQTHGGSPGGDCDFAAPLGFSFVTHR